jgi:hypothetical protein
LEFAVPKRFIFIFIFTEYCLLANFDILPTSSRHNGLPDRVFDASCLPEHLLAKFLINLFGFGDFDNDFRWTFDISDLDQASLECQLRYFNPTDSEVFSQLNQSWSTNGHILIVTGQNLDWDPTKLGQRADALRQVVLHFVKLDKQLTSQHFKYGSHDGTVRIVSPSSDSMVHLSLLVVF